MKRRAIKFRVWNNKTKSWVHGPGQEPHLFGETILLGGFMQGVPLLDLDDCVPLQFTGLLDKNGVEIYEGDIVRFQYRDEGEFYGVVGMDDMYVGFSVQESKAFFGSINLTYYNNKDHTVVGNIYENPELL